MMITKLFFSIAITTALFACTNKTPVTDTGVATTFIRGVLDNDFKTAQQYLLKDETNQQYFETFQRQYQSSNKTELGKYKAADILINSIEQASDTTTIINFSNSYKKNIAQKLKLLRRDGRWLIDLKYTFAENQ
jgi:type IV secretory pathway component VirB8